MEFLGGVLVFVWRILPGYLDTFLDTFTVPAIWNQQNSCQACSSSKLNAQLILQRSGLSLITLKPRQKNGGIIYYVGINNQTGQLKNSLHLFDTASSVLLIKSFHCVSIFIPVQSYANDRPNVNHYVQSTFISNQNNQ